MASYNYYWQQVCPSIYTPTVPRASVPEQSGHGGLNDVSLQQFGHTHPPGNDLIGGAEAPTSAQSANACKLAPDIHLKVFNPTNKKEYKMFTLRSVPMDETDSPEKLKKVIIDQCCDSFVAKRMDIGYFKQSKKFWLNNRLDMNDLWDLIHNGENITLWCIEMIEQTRKRTQLDASEAENYHADKDTKKAKKLSKMEEKKIEAEKYEQILSEKHGDKFTSFQYKLWAEMYVGKKSPFSRGTPCCCYV